MKILPIPCLEDNYAYLIIDKSSGEGAVVDPVEPEKVLKVANNNGVSLKLVLTTHNHCLWLAVGNSLRHCRADVSGSVCDTQVIAERTRVFCDHEYTEKNLLFALTIEPENEHIKQKLSWAKHQREGNQPTVPSTIEEEMNINPFMRVDMLEIQRRVGRSSAVEALRELRSMKDDWTG